MRIISIILIAFLNLVYANEVKFYQPSFDCSKVKENSVEYEICTNKDLSDWDKVLTEIYEKILKEIPKKEELKNDQREFLKDREICNEQNNKVSCIEESYKNRIYTLNNIFALSNINKSQKIKDTKNFIQLNDEIKSHLFINTFLDKIDIFEKKNYILLENGFLFKDLYSRGIYYANSQTGKMKKIYDWIEPWVFIKNSKPIKLAVRNSGENSGKGYENIAIITIKDDDNTENQTIIETQYDMESGLCGRAEELRLTKAGDIENFKYDEENNQLVIDFTEQDCSNKEITKKQLVYDLQSEDINNSNIDYNKNKPQIENIKKIISSFQKNDIDYIANNLIDFPLGRDYPIPNINNQEELKKRFNEIFDEELTKKIQNSKAEDWEEMGWRGIMLDRGIIWLDEYGEKIKAVNYQSNFEKNLKQKLINQDKENLHSSLKDFVFPVYTIKTKNYLIRIDSLSDKYDSSNYRYATWKLPEDENLKPDLVLLKGQIEFDGSGGNHHFTFLNKEYIYKVYINVMGTDETPEVELKVIKGDEIILKEDGNIQKNQNTK